MSGIIYVKAKATAVAETIEAIVDALDDRDEDTVMLASIGLAILCQDRDIERAKFVDLIKDVSEYITLRLVDTEGKSS